MRPTLAVLVFMSAVAPGGAAVFDRPPDIVARPRGPTSQATRDQLIREARKARALEASRAYWARKGDGMCYRRPFFTVYGWRTGRVCGTTGTSIRFE